MWVSGSTNTNLWNLKKKFFFAEAERPQSFFLPPVSALGASAAAACKSRVYLLPLCRVSVSKVKTPLPACVLITGGFVGKLTHWGNTEQWEASRCPCSPLTDWEVEKKKKKQKPLDPVFFGALQLVLRVGVKLLKLERTPRPHWLGSW